MNDSPSRWRVFFIALLGLALGIALSKFSNGTVSTLIVIVLAIIAFALFRMRTGR